MDLPVIEVEVDGLDPISIHIPPTYASSPVPVHRTTEKPTQVTQARNISSSATARIDKYLCAGCSKHFSWKAARYTCCTCEDEFDLCTKCFRSQVGQTHDENHTLVRVSSSPSPDPYQPRPFFGWSPGLVNLFGGSLFGLSSVHDDIVCDSCHTTPVVGNRFKFLFMDSDLCASCEEKIEIPHGQPLLLLRRCWTREQQRVLKIYDDLEKVSLFTEFDTSLCDPPLLSLPRFQDQDLQYVHDAYHNAHESFWQVFKCELAYFDEFSTNSIDGPTKSEGGWVKDIRIQRKAKDGVGETPVLIQNLREVYSRRTTVRDFEGFLGYVKKIDVPVIEESHLICDFTGDPLGVGAAMKVFVGMLSTSNSQVAVKRSKVSFRPGNLTTFEQGQVLNELAHELRIMTHMRGHPNVVSLHGMAFFGDGPEKVVPMLVVELAVDNAASFFQKKGDCVAWGEHEWIQAAHICSDVADGLHALHLCDVVHGDVKAENILLFRDDAGEVDGNWTFTAKVSDFGYSVSRVSLDSRDGRLGHTTAFLAPEMLASRSNPGKGFTKSALARLGDVYAFGLFVWQVLSNGGIPFDGLSSDTIVELKEDRDDVALEVLKDSLPVGIPPKFFAVIDSTVVHDPRQRLLVNLQDIRTPLMAGVPEEFQKTKYQEAKNLFEKTISPLPRSVAPAGYGDIEKMPITQALRMKLVKDFDKRSRPGSKDADAIFSLALCYGAGFAVERDIRKMMQLVVQAAKAGSMRAAETLTDESLLRFAKEVAYGQYERNFSKEDVVLRAVWREIVLADEAALFVASRCLPLAYKHGILESARKRHFGQLHSEEELLPGFEWRPSRSSSGKPIVPYEDTLVRAVRDGDTTFVRKFVEAVPMADRPKILLATDDRDRSLLHTAAECGQVEVIDLLIDEFGMDVNGPMANTFGTTPLEIAFGAAQDKAYFHLRNKHNARPMRRVIQTESFIEIILKEQTGLIEDWALMSISGVDGVDSCGLRFIDWAVATNSIAMVRFLREELHAELEKPNGMSPLHIAARLGYDRMVLQLLDYGMDLNGACMGCGRIALDHAVTIVQTRTAGLLLKRQPRQSSNSWYKVLRIFCADETIDDQSIKTFIQAMGDVNQRSPYDISALDCAAFDGNTRAAKLLLECGADPNAVDEHRHTILHHAAECGHLQNILEASELLKSSIAVRDAHGHSCADGLILARGVFDSNVLKTAMLLMGDKVSVTDIRGHTLLHHAAQAGLLKEVLLIAYDLEVGLEVADGNSLTPNDIENLRREFVALPEEERRIRLVKLKEMISNGLQLRDLAVSELAFEHCLCWWVSCKNRFI